MQMQVRFDGLFGFPGGYIDSTDKSIIDGLNRELLEEMNFDTEKYQLTQDNHIVSTVCSHRKLVTHFYAIEVTRPQYEDIEKRAFTAHDWGAEVRLTASEHEFLVCLWSRFDLHG